VKRDIGANLQRRAEPPSTSGFCPEFIIPW
jgi:hypothetical protein